jgi:hypothetical protein
MKEMLNEQRMLLLGYLRTAQQVWGESLPCL